MLLTRRSLLVGISAAIAAPAIVRAESLMKVRALPWLLPADSLYVSLHTGDPGEYARVAVPRSSGAWTVSEGVASNAATITFPACGDGATITHFSVSTNSGTLIKGALSRPLKVWNGVTPVFDAGALTITAC